MSKVVYKNQAMVIVATALLTRFCLSMILVGLGSYFVYPLIGEMSGSSLSAGERAYLWLGAMCFIFALFILFRSKGVIIDRSSGDVIIYGRILGIKYRWRSVPISCYKFVGISKEILVIRDEGRDTGRRQINFRAVLSGRVPLEIVKGPEHHQIKNISFKVAQFLEMEVHDLTQKKKKVFDKEFVQKAIV